MAEALIAIAIIGIIAALTIPQLVTNYQKHVVETHLREFYSTINQAIRMYVATNGELETPANFGRDYNYQENYNWVSTHILPYIKYAEVYRCSNDVCVKLLNGDMFEFNMTRVGGDLVYFIDSLHTSKTQRKRFAFQFYKLQADGSSNLNAKNFIEPYTFNWDGTINGIKNHNKYGCRRGSQSYLYIFCAKYIQLNNWKIPDDYPW